MSQRTRSQGGVSIAHEARGDGPPVVFVHAFPLDRRMWQAQLDGLDGYRRIALDLRGFGESAPAAGPTTMVDLAADVRAVLGAYGVENAHLVGCSMGGYVLMELLRQSPWIATTLALVDTRAGADSETARSGRMETVERLRAGGESARHELETGMLDKLLGVTSRASRPPLVHQVRSMMAAASLSGVIGALEAMAARPDSHEVLRRLDAPALVVLGVEDTLIPADDARQMVEALPRADLLLIPEAGHLPPVERPDVLNASLLRLWASV
jgi:3-oxoadipate enol-lactonase